MKEIHQKIWDLALRYQDLRDDKGHAEVVVGFSYALLFMEKANEDVVIPGSILHDIGWRKIPRKIRVYAGAKTPEEDKARRLKHEKEGKKEGKKILNKVGYDKDLSEHILKIVDGHDTRKGTFSMEDSIVRDSDKLWRFSNVGFWTAIRNLKIPPEKEYNKLINQINEEGFFFTESARILARGELEQRKKEIDRKKEIIS